MEWCDLYAEYLYAALTMTPQQQQSVSIDTPKNQFKVSTMPKRLVLAIDGTWVSSDNGYSPSIWGPSGAGTLASPSNVTRLCRALKSRASGDIEQIVYYQGGLGSQANIYSFVVGGYLGEGIDAAIREAYGFLANNYEDGDEIFLLGFSRGAFTARSVSGLIASIGLLTKEGMESFYPIFMDWEHQNNPNYVPGYQTTAWEIKGRPKMGPSYFERLVSKSLSRPTIPVVKAIAVFDTVGSLGVPDIKPFGWKLHQSSKAEYSFVNTQLSTNVENAYQALALDEQRDAFVPTVWESPQEKTHPIFKSLRQCWFAGVHTSIGGGYQDTSISDVTLSWMMTQLSAHLEFDPAYLQRQRKLNEEFYDTRETKVPQEARGYGMGLIKRSDLGLLNTVLGRQVRTPGEYHLTDPKTGEPIPQLLKNTCEFIHPSVRYRIDNKGRGLANSATDFLGGGIYRPAALKDWDYYPAGSEVPGLTVDPKWTKAAKWVKKNLTTYIVEDRIEHGSADWLLAESYGGNVGTFLG